MGFIGAIMSNSNRALREALGVKPYEVNFWVHRGLHLTGTTPGKARKFSEKDLLRLAIFAALRKLLPPSRLRKIVEMASRRPDQKYVLDDYGYTLTIDCPKLLQDLRMKLDRNQ